MMSLLAQKRFKSQEEEAARRSTGHWSNSPIEEEQSSLPATIAAHKEVSWQNKVQSRDTADFWDTQQILKLISWKLHSSSGVHTIMTSTGLVIHMFVENRYPLAKEVLSKMLELKLETEEESSMALDAIKFVNNRVNTPGSDENRLKLYDLMYKIFKVADTRVKD
ncbi:hypothetical protein Tco_1080957 [Tanacetum coccineum]|uniref:Pentatricopeptide repeat-containing protein n=1 Tax=Tanacetum coccineum TaxID=301880 RepID=A0ABQ5HXT5_9ASTR